MFLSDKERKNLLLLDKIVKIFPNVKEIICEQTDCINPFALFKQYSDTIVNAEFISNVQKRLSELDKGTSQLTKIVITTHMYEIRNKFKIENIKEWKIGQGGKTIVITKRSDDAIFSELITKFAAMVNGQYLKYGEATSLDVPIFKTLINNRVRKVPSDVQELWNKLMAQTVITIDMKHMYEHYKEFMPWLIVGKCQNLLCLDKIELLFPNLTEIVCKNTDYVGFGKDANGYKANAQGYSTDIVHVEFTNTLLNMLENLPNNTRLLKVTIATTQNQKNINQINNQQYLEKNSGNRFLIAVENNALVAQVSGIDFIDTINSMLTGKPKLHVPASYVNTFKQLIFWDENLPLNIKESWKEDTQKQETITINMECMYKYYSDFIPLLFLSKDRSVFRLDSILKLFPQVNSIRFIDKNGLVASLD